MTVAGIFLTVRYTGYKAISAGLQADTFIEATQIVKQKLGYDDLISSTSVPRQVMAIARDADPYSRLANSIAPEIFGHEDVKKALLLQLVGGVTRTLPDGESWVTALNFHFSLELKKKLGPSNDNLSITFDPLIRYED